MTRRELIALAAAFPLAKAETKPSIIGDGWGLDHLINVLPDGELVKSIYTDKLGFTVFPGAKRPAGYENAIISLFPAYLELVFFYDRSKAEASVNDDPTMKRRLALVDQGGGPNGYNIDVSPIDRAVSALRERGMEVSLPPSRILLRPDGTQVRGPWQFLAITKTVEPPPPSGVPGGDRVGFLEYTDNKKNMSATRWQEIKENAEREFPDPRRRAGEFHANTARKMASVWVAVESIQQAMKHCELFGFPSIGDRKSAFLGAKGREVQCGQGTIVFWESTQPKSKLAGIVGKLGLGVFGVRVEVADLKICHEIVEKGVGNKLVQESATAFVVPADVTGGVWIEFGPA